MKKIIATLCAFSLALTLPVAAFADDVDSTEPEGTIETQAGDVTVDPAAAATPDSLFEVEEDGDTATITPTKDIYSDIIDKIEIEGAEKITASAPNYSNYDPDKVKEYQELLMDVVKDKGEHMFTVEINGDVTADDHAVVTFYLDKDEWGGKVVTYYILHENGDIQSKVVRVHNDGTVRIWMEGFSIITFMDVNGITKYENLVEPQDGDELSPQTGF